MASEHNATILWQRGDQSFIDKKFSRAHVWRFDDGCEVAGSCPPSKLIPPPMSKPDAVDPEEGLVASLSACHMLFFLGFAAKGGYRIDVYEDHAVGVLGKNESGKTYMERITLRPAVTFSGDKKPDAEAIAELHRRAHAECLIGNSLRSTIVIDPSEPQFA